MASTNNSSPHGTPSDAELEHRLQDERAQRQRAAELFRGSYDEDPFDDDVDGD